MSIPFTQFLMPSGRPRRVEIDRSEEIEAKARAVIAVGGRFEIEVLPTRIINIELMLAGECVCGRLCDNNEQVPPTVDELVTEAHQRLVERRNDETRSA